MSVMISYRFRTLEKIWSVTFNDEKLTDSKKSPEYFKWRFVEYPGAIGRRVLRRVRSLSAEETPPQFTVRDVANIIRNVKLSQALCPHGISMVKLKQLDKLGVMYLTKVLNLSLATNIAWKWAGLPRYWSQVRMPAKAFVASRKHSWGPTPPQHQRKLPAFVVRTRRPYSIYIMR